MHTRLIKKDKGDDLDLRGKKKDSCLRLFIFNKNTCMVGRKLNDYVLREVIRKWDKKVRFQIHERGWIAFFFENDEDRQLVFKGGPYLVFVRYLYLKRCTLLFI